MYEPKIKVVRKMGANSWYLDDGRYRSDERAYLVLGLPMPGDRVVVPAKAVRVVLGLHPSIKTTHAYTVDDQSGAAVYEPFHLTPYDPEAERLRVATEAVRKLDITDSEIQMVDIARAVDEAYRKGGFLKEVNDG